LGSEGGMSGITLKQNAFKFENETKRNEINENEAKRNEINEMETK
jgi:hypothetical protein